MDGVLNINKPKGPTSHDIVEMARKCLGIRKIGHAGTLDPLAEGVLLLCVGKATRISEYLMELPKEYIAEITFGVTTSTYDAEGEIISRSDITVTQEEIKKVLNKFVGEIEQVPPPASAIHHKGKRLYELARRGENIELQPRKVYVYKMELLNFIPEGQIGMFRIVCSKGTYIRAIARDLGEILQCGAYLSNLLRTRVGSFSIRDAIPASELKRENRERILADLIPMGMALTHLPLLQVDTEKARKVSHGNSLPLPGKMFSLGDKVKVTDEKGNLISIGRVVINRGKVFLQPEKVFRDG